MSGNEVGAVSSVGQSASTGASSFMSNPSAGKADLSSLFEMAPAKTDGTKHVAINDIGNWLNGGNTGTNTGGFQA